MIENKAQGELDLAWKSDLANRNYKGGETVGGTTEDDLHGEKTDFLPSGIDPDELGDKQKSILQAWATLPPRDRTVGKIAEKADASRNHTEWTLERFVRTREYSELSDRRQMAIDALARNPDLSLKDLAEEAGIRHRLLRRVRQAYPELIEERSEYLDEDGGTNESPDSENPVNKPRSEKEYPEDFTECQRHFIEVAAANPDISAPEAAEGTDWSEMNLYNVKRQYQEVIQQRREELQEPTDDTESAVENSSEVTTTEAEDETLDAFEEDEQSASDSEPDNELSDLDDNEVDVESLIFRVAAIVCLIYETYSEFKNLGDKEVVEQ